MVTGTSSNKFKQITENRYLPVGSASLCKQWQVNTYKKYMRSGSEGNIKDFQ